MPNFKVLRRVDSFSDYVADVTASNAEEAALLAYKNEEKYQWAQTGTQEFDARVYITVDENGIEVPETEIQDY